MNKPEPIVKWAGGKRRILPKLEALYPDDVDERRHVELFLGGGAMFFSRKPKHALLSDLNTDLMSMYRCVKCVVDDVIDHLQILSDGHCEKQYYLTREKYNKHRSGGPWSAAMFLYLNKTCFNGLYRVNKKGEFNVPIGSYKSPKILDQDRLRAASKHLANATLGCMPFQRYEDYFDANDFIYMDPPYEPLPDSKGFTKYTAGGFTQKDQIRLKDMFWELDWQGCKMMLSNSACPFIYDLYKDFNITPIMAPRSISADGNKRNLAHEVVIRNY